MNKAILQGRLTKDIELRYTDNNLAVARFNLALNRGKDKNGQDRGADFPSCIAFGKTAENLQKYTEKGSRVAIDGHIQTNNYEKDGQRIYTTDIVCDRVEFIDFAEKGTQDANQSVTGGFEDITDEDIPFLRGRE